MRIRRLLLVLFACGIAMCYAKQLEAVQQPAAPPTVYTEVIELTIHPAAEPIPALKYKFLPDEFELKDGNAAVFYLKAEGFLEQSSARKQLDELERKAVESANEKKVETSSVAPFSYLEMAPSDYPIEEVKKYLALTAFQPPMLAEAAARRSFQMDRQIKDVKNPVSYLLPEIQGMRDLARKQSIRCRLAIAENRIDDALTILGQQFALARHLCQDDFVVSTLVGCAIERIAMRDAWYLVQHKDCPNLYWAFAQLPNLADNWKRCLAYEKHFLELQFPQLAEVDTKIKSTEYWRQFIDRLNEDMNANGVRYWENFQNESSMTLPNSRALIISHIASSYPEAKALLLEHKIISPESIDSYPTAQVYFLAMKLHLKISTDEIFKWLHLPLHVGRKQPTELDTSLSDVNAPAFTSISKMLASIHSVRSVQARVSQRLPMIQAVEAIRMYGVTHQNSLPESLDKLDYPIANDPASGKPFQYSVDGNVATLSSTPPGDNIQLIFKIRFAGAK